MKNEFRFDIEGLRGIAVLLVVLYHCQVPGFSGGYIGVDIFFTISGYLITTLLVKEVTSAGRISYGHFFARRARRLLPAALLIVIAVLIIGRFVYSPLEQVGIYQTAVATSLYSSNLLFAWRSTDYLAPDAGGNPLLHTWSLGVEEQFYFLWPVLVAVGMCHLPRRSGRGALTWLMCALAIASFGAGLWLTRFRPAWAFFGSPMRGWEFAVGGLAACLTVRSRLQSSPLLPWMGMLAIVGASVCFTRTTVFPGVAALIPVLGSVALLFAGACRTTGLIMRSLASPFLQWLGRLSYSWYLWHWPVLVLAAAAVGRLGAISRIVCAALALGLSTLTFFTVERPVRISRPLVIRPRLSLVLAGSVTLLSLGLCATFLHLAFVAENTGTQRAFTLAHGDLPKVYNNGCHVDYRGTASPSCTFGDVNATASIVLFGDSHAAQWFPAFDKICKKNHWQLISLTKSGCPSASIDIINKQLGRHYVECNQWRLNAIQRIIRLRPSAIILANSNYYTVQERAYSISANEWAKGLRNTLSQFADVGLHTLVLRDTPQPGFDVLSCQSRAEWVPWRRSESCSFERSTSAYESLADLDRAVTREIANASYADVFSTICAYELCAPVQNGMIIFQDASHLTATYAASLSPVLEPQLEYVVSQSLRNPRRAES